MSTDPYETILEPIVTEKTVRLLENQNKITFRVADDATKPKIRSAIETLFDVRVEKVNTCNMPSQPRRVGRYIGYSQSYKKAYITLHEDDYIDYYALDRAGAEEGTV